MKRRKQRNSMEDSFTAHGTKTEVGLEECGQEVMADGGLGEQLGGGGK